MKKLIMLLLIICTNNAFGFVVTYDSSKKEWYIENERLEVTLWWGHHEVTDKKTLEKYYKKTSAEEKNNDCRQAYKIVMNNFMKLEPNRNDEFIIPNDLDDNLRIVEHHVTYDNKEEWYTLEKTDWYSLSVFTNLAKVDSYNLIVYDVIKKVFLKKGGVILTDGKINGELIFLYSKNLNYNKGEKFKSDFLLKRIGSYKYTNSEGKKMLIPAFEQLDFQKEQLFFRKNLKSPSINCMINSEIEKIRQNIFRNVEEEAELIYADEKYPDGSWLHL